MRADRGERGEQRHVVEDPAADRREQRVLPLRAERLEDLVALAQQAAGEPGERLGLRPQAVADALGGAPDPAQRPVGRQQHRADPGGDGEDRDARRAGLEQAAVHRAAHERRDREHRQRQHDREDEQVDRRQRGHRRGSRQPGLDEHAVLQRGADRTAAGRDVRQRVARELRGDHRPPVAGAQREALQVPEARVRRDLEDGHRGERGEREARDLPPRAEDVDDAREHEVQRHGRDRPARARCAAGGCGRSSSCSPRSISPGVSAWRSIARSTLSPSELTGTSVMRMPASHVGRAPESPAGASRRAWP